MPLLSVWIMELLLFGRPFSCQIDGLSVYILTYFAVTI